MKLDEAFAKEIKKAANGDGGREYKFAFIKEIQEIAFELGNRYAFEDCLKKYGRARVAICVAATITAHADDPRYEIPQKAWAIEVMKLWTNQAGERSRHAATINIHPAILADNSYSLRKLTTAQ